jgi:hypothetical protein
MEVILSVHKDDVNTNVDLSPEDQAHILQHLMAGQRICVMVEGEKKWLEVEFIEHDMVRKNVFILSHPL